jgi:chromosome segregation ATPase
MQNEHLVATLATNDKLAELTEQINASQNENKLLLERNNDLNQNYDIMSKELTNAKKQILDLQKSVELFEQERSDLIEEIKDLQMKVEINTPNEIILSDQVYKLEKELRDTKDRNVSIIQNQDILNEKLNQSSQHCHDLQNLLEMSKKERIQMMGNMKEIENYNNQLQSSLNEVLNSELHLKNQLGSIQKQLMSSEDLSVSYKMKISQLTKELSDITSRLEERQMKIDNIERSYHQQNKDYQDQISNLKEQITMVVNELNNERLHSKALQEQLKEAEISFSEVQESFSCLMGVTKTHQQTDTIKTDNVITNSIPFSLWHSKLVTLSEEATIIISVYLNSRGNESSNKDLILFDILEEVGSRLLHIQALLHTSPLQLNKLQSNTLQSSTSLVKEII